MYRIRKPTTNFENIPVSSMEGPSSPTSVTFWKRGSCFSEESNEIIVRKTANVEKEHSNKILFPRVKKTAQKSALAGGHLMGNKEIYMKRNSRPLTDQSRPSSPPSIRNDTNRAVERQIKETRKAIAEYMKTTSRGKKYKDLSRMSVLSTGANVRTPHNLQHLNRAIDLSDNSRDISTANTCSDLPPDGCWAFLNHEGNNKKQVSTKDSIAQTSSCLIKSRPPQPEADHVCKASVPKKSHKNAANKSIYSSVRQRPKWQQNTHQAKNQLQMSHSQAAGKRKLKIPDHQIIYMDKLDPNGKQFWAQIASELDKPESRVQGRTKHGHH